MIHEKTASKDKQSIASVEAELLNRSMREVRRESIISTDEIKDKFDAVSTLYRIQNFDQLKY
jgi:ribosomal protein S25